jgi:hypothetical protein
VFAIGVASLAGFSVPVVTAHAPRPAGAVVGGVSGFRVSDVSFSLDRSRLERVRRVSFALTPSNATTVRVALGGEHASCDVRAGRALCLFRGAEPRLQELASLTVVAAS